MDSNPTVSDLRKADEISDDEINAAVQSYLAEQCVEPFRFAAGHVVDIGAAIEGHPFAKAALSDGRASIRRVRSSIRTAILLAHPVKG